MGGLATLLSISVTLVGMFIVPSLQDLWEGGDHSYLQGSVRWNDLPGFTQEEKQSQSCSGLSILGNIY